MSETSWIVNVFVGCAAVLAAACGNGDGKLQRGLESITVDDLTAHILTLASDEFEGRGPSSPGEEKTIDYLRSEFERLRLEPGNGESFLQEVPLVEITADSSAILSVRHASGVDRFRYKSDFMAVTLRVTERVALDRSEMVFVGYGVVAPEYDWNDYEGMDVHGKTVVILVNDPGFATQDSSLFNGNAMTYYGRWTYKFEEAARQGAAGAFVVHETEAAGYPWEVVSNSWSGPQFSLVAEDNNMSRAVVEGWIQLASARRIFRRAGLEYDDLKERASQRGFEGVSMNVSASLTLNNTIRRSFSNNLVAVWPGSERADEYVVYMAHWDHLGRDPTREGDQIFNGARDNATGTAGLIELAEAFANLASRPSRSILFLATTAEEQGLLGSLFYATNPVFPLMKTVAALNMDAMNTFGKTRDVTVVGFGNSELDDYVVAAASGQRRTVRPDPEPEKGFYYRSDHFSFAKHGVPALYVDPGIDHVEYGEQWMLDRLAEYTAQRYHKPEDEYTPDWDLTGAVEDVRLLFIVGYRLSTESTFPNWREGTEFKAMRDAQMKSGDSR